jgi:hypothetical protein
MSVKRLWNIFKGCVMASLVVFAITTYLVTMTATITLSFFDNLNTSLKDKEEEV